MTGPVQQGARPPPQNTPQQYPPQAWPPPPRKKRSVAKILGVVAAIIVGGFIALVILGTILSSSDQAAPTAAEVDEAFAPVGNFSYAELPPEALAEAERSLRAEGGQEVIEEFDLRQVLSNGREFGLLVIYSIDPDASLFDGEQEDFVRGFEERFGSSLEEASFGETEGYLGGPSQLLGYASVFFDDDGLVFSAFANDRADLMEFTEGLADANR